MNTPLVSVLIPCYNAARWVGETLDSAFAQTWPNLEVVLVNDGSTDGTREILERYEPMGLRVIDQPNRGQTSALNRCLREANGDFVQYLDADDLMAPDKITIQMERLAARDDCIASAEWARFWEGPSRAEFNPYPTWRDMAPIDWLVANWGDGGPGIATSNAAARAAHDTTAIRVRLSSSSVARVNRIAAANCQIRRGTSGCPSSRAMAGLIGRYFTLTAAPTPSRS